jgi:hypothetical protein
MTLELWAFRAEVRTEGADLSGMAVQALDGGIGKVAEVVERESRTFLLVDTGPWIFGKTIKLPAGLVAGVEPAQGIVFVDRPKDDIKDAPEQDGDLADDGAHADALTRHYAAGRDEAAVAAAPSPPPEAPATVPGGGIGDAEGAEGAPPGDAAPGFLEGEAEGGDEPPIPAPAPPLAGPIEARPAGADGDRADTGTPASERDEDTATPPPVPSEPSASREKADTVAPPSVPDAPAPPAPEPAAAEPAGARDDAAPAPAGAPGPNTPEPSGDDAPSPLSGLATGTPPDAEERDREQPPPKDDAAPERPGRRASAPSRGRAAERPDRAPARKRADAPSPATPARKRADAPSRATPARKRAEAPSRAKSTEADKAPKTRARRESAPAPAKRQARSGATSRNDQPIARYDALTAAEVVGRLRALTQSELAKVERYEKRGEERQTILKRVASLREKEPWRGYDTATVKEVRERLARAKEDRVTAVRDYERRHRNRTGVMDAARRRLETM